MSNFFLLLKVQFLSLFGVNKIAHSKKNKNAKFFGVGALAFLFCALIIGVGFLYGKGLSGLYLNDVNAFITTMIAISACVCLVFTFYSSSTVLYGYKDYDMLSAMPIKTRTIIMAKLSFMYFADLIFTILILLPTTYFACFEMGGLSAETLIRLFFITITVPLFPMVVSLLVGAGFTYISAKFRRRNLIQLLLTSVFIIAVIALSYINADLSDPFVLIKRVYVAFPLVILGLGSWLYAMIFCLSSVAIGALVLIIIAASYKRMNGITKSHKKNKAFVMKKTKAKGLFKTLFFKELKTLFSYPIYVSNTLFAPLLGAVAGVVLIVMSSDPIVATYGVYIAPSIFAFIFLTSPTTACSIAVEGSAFWVVKTFPIPYKTMFDAKLAVNATFSILPAILLSVASTLNLLGVSIMYMVLMLIIGVSIVLFGGNLGLILNVYFPNLKWETVNKAVKQGGALMLMVMVSLIASALLGIIMLVLVADVMVKLIIVAVLFTALTISSYIFIIKKCEGILTKRS